MLRLTKDSGKNLLLGILLGLFLGILGNLFVTSLYRLINPGIIQNVVTVVVSVGLIVIISSLVFSILKKL